MAWSSTIKRRVRVGFMSALSVRGRGLEIWGLGGVFRGWGERWRCVFFRDGRGWVWRGESDRKEEAVGRVFVDRAVFLYEGAGRG